MLRPCLVWVLRCVLLAFWLVPAHPFAAEPPFAGLPIPDHASLVAAVIADGVQIYEAKRLESGGYRWELKGPQAVLTTISGERFGRHDVGPTWTADDGSQVVGTVMAKADAPGPNAIPWLLLTVKAKTGSGVLSGVDYVLRVGTAGGNAPPDPPTQEGETKRTPYRALYLFLKKTAGS
ncbi:MAG: DUF3455 domain-containing protein [Verrucomicrobia bacterium]|nr:DUF3455 domain-containing protein [Verrucomicrobiota bacterium]